MKSLITALLILSVPAVSAATPEQETALRDITAFTAKQAKADPLYGAVEPQLLLEVDDIIRKQPPAEWAPTIRRRYFALAEKAHMDERTKIRDAEVAVIERGPKDPQAAWRARLTALDASVAAGELGPREHALHMLEAVKLIMPDDVRLIALRQEKVTLATEYELGALSRAQYDQRWSMAQERYYQGAKAAATAQAMDAAVMDQAAAAARAQAIADGFRRARGINCISRPSPLGTTINCQ